MVEPIDDFERELREELAARPAPEGFAARVMARAAEREHRRGWFRQPALQWATAFALAAAMTAGAGVEHAREQRAKGEKARAEVMLALRITGQTLRDVQRKIDNQTGNGETRED